MKKIEFARIDGDWYFVNNNYQGDQEDLKVNKETSMWVDIYCFYEDKISLEIYDFEPTIDTYNTLNLIDYDESGANYQVVEVDNEDYPWVMRIPKGLPCFEDGGFPETIYCNLKLED